MLIYFFLIVKELFYQNTRIQTRVKQLFLSGPVIQVKSDEPISEVGFGLN